MGRMRAVRLFAPGDLRCVEIEKPVMEKENEVIIKVKACGVCGSDIMRVMVKGAYKHPITIGHEFSGTIVEVHSNQKSFSIGDRVTVMPLKPCGQCDYCKIGQHVLCNDYQYYGSRIDGAMAEYAKVNIDNIIKLPLNVDFESGAMADPASVALHAVRKADLEPGQNVGIFGLGAIGLLAIQWLRYSGCSSIFAIDIFDEKLELAEKLGADFCINARKSDPVEEIMIKTHSRGLDAIIELSGSKASQINAIESTRKQGSIILCGISYEDLLISNSTLSKILRNELKIIGSWNSLISTLPVNEWGSSLIFMSSGRIKCNPIVSHRYKLEQCIEAFDMMFNRKQIFNKVLFKPED